MNIRLHELNQEAQRTALLQAGTVAGAKTHARRQGERLTLCGLKITEHTDAVFEWYCVRIADGCGRCAQIARLL